MGRTRYVAITLCVGALALGSSFGLAATEIIAPSNVWPQTHSDIPADPDIVFGTLPNGMRYLIKKNANPAHGVSLRLRIAAGSLEEPGREKGLAHFLEHMAFRGSEHLPDGAAIKMLESVGVSLQADLNARTFPDGTVFEFDLPANDDATLDKGMLLTREIASRLTLDPKAVDSERAVVLAEIRQRDTAALHMAQGYLAAVLGAPLASGINALGDAAIIKGATAAQLRAFYQANYRPENATLIIIGDIDPKAIEAKIKAQFSDWKNTSPKPGAPVYAIRDPAPAPDFKIFSEQGAGAAIQIGWATPFDTATDTIAHTRHEIIRNISLAVLNLRLQKLAQSGKPPFVAATATYSPIFGAADIASIGVSYGSGNVLDALRAAHDTYAEILAKGVSQDEVDQAVAQWRSLYQSLVAVSNTLPDKALASGYLVSLALNSVIELPQEAAFLFEDTAKNLQAQDVTAALRSLFAANPLVYVSSPAPIPGGEAALASAFRQTSSAENINAVTPAAAAQAWPYTNFGPAGAIASQKTIADLGATFVTFANGVRATIKPTKFLAGQVAIDVRFGDGRLGLPRNGKIPAWALPGSFVAGGLRKLDLDEMQKILAGKEWNAILNVADDAYELKGQTRTTDFVTELQVLTAYMSDPAWRPAAFARMQSAVTDALGQADATPDGTLGLHLGALVHNGDARWQSPTLDGVRATHPEEVTALLSGALAAAPIEVTVVGDITVEEAVERLRETFGALPRRRTSTAPVVGDEQLPAPGSATTVLKYHGPGNQAVAFIAWPTTGMFPDLRAIAAQDILERILAQRLFDTLRTQDGMSYTPQTLAAHSLVTPGYGFLGVYADIPAEKIPDFYAAVAKTVDALKVQPISDSELAQARAPAVGDLVRAKQNNAYWLANLGDAQIDPRRIDLIRSDVSDLQDITAADVQDAAKAYLSGDKAWKVITVPQDYNAPATLK